MAFVADPRITCAVIKDATAVTWLEHGILLLGPSGAGKSDLALRIVDAGGGLVADDLVKLSSDGKTVTASAHALEGHIEIRGVGIFDIGYAGPARLDLAIQLVSPAKAQAGERLPDPASIELLGVALPSIVLDPQAGSALARLRAVLKAVRIDA